MGLGIILNQPKDPTTNDNWALVSSGIVQNVIIANLPCIQKLANQYDYLVDVSVGGQSTGPGYTYNVDQNTFNGPVQGQGQTPQQQLQGLFDAVATDLLNCVDIAQGISQAAINVAWLNSVGDSQSQFTPNEAAIFQQVCIYISQGG